MSRIERKKIPSVGFDTPQVIANPMLIRPVDQAPIYNPVYKPKGGFMLTIKRKAAQWAIGVLARVPEQYIWDFLKTIVQRLEKHMNDPKTPNWMKVSYRLLENILAAVDPQSPAGRKITKEELKQIIDDLW